MDAACKCKCNGGYHTNRSPARKRTQETLGPKRSQKATLARGIPQATVPSLPDPTKLRKSPSHVSCHCPANGAQGKRSVVIRSAKRGRNTTPKPPITPHFNTVLIIIPRDNDHVHGGDFCGSSASSVRMRGSQTTFSDDWFQRARPAACRRRRGVFDCRSKAGPAVPKRSAPHESMGA